MAVAPAVALALLAATPALAATTISHTRFQGDVAFATFERFDPCRDTATGLQANNGKTTDLLSGRTSTSHVQGFAALQDTCTTPATQIKLWFFNADLAPGQFSVTGRKATLSTVVPASDFLGNSATLTIKRYVDGDRPTGPDQRHPAVDERWRNLSPALLGNRGLRDGHRHRLRWHHELHPGPVATDPGADPIEQQRVSARHPPLARPAQS